MNIHLILLKTLLALNLILPNVASAQSSEKTSVYVVSPFMMSWASTQVTILEFPSATTDVITAISDKDENRMLLGLQLEAREFLLNGQMGDALARQIDFILLGAERSKQERILKMSDRELALEILLFAQAEMHRRKSKAPPVKKDTVKEPVKETDKADK